MAFYPFNEVEDDEIMEFLNKMDKRIEEKKSKKVVKKVKCQCGGSRLKLPHSDWCPLYE